MRTLMGIYLQGLAQSEQEHYKVSGLLGLAKSEMTEFADKEKFSTKQTATEISVLNQIFSNSSLNCVPIYQKSDVQRN